MMPAVTKKQIETLVKVQQIEIEAGKLKTYLAAVPARLSSLEQQLEEFIHSVEDDEAVIEDFNKHYRSFESDVQLNLAKIQKSQEKLRSVKTNKEYQSSLKEIDDIKTANSKLEDEMLAFLEQIETAEAALKDRKQHYNAIVDDANQEKQEIKRDAQQREATLVELEAKHAAIAAGVDGGLLEIFSRVKTKQLDEVAIVAVRDAVCQGCNMNIPPQVYNELQRCDSLKYCPHCHRIIYWQNQEERPE
jgi:predicted  nucleic acid-binding Zn-ribbon protein